MKKKVLMCIVLCATMAITCSCGNAKNITNDTNKVNTDIVDSTQSTVVDENEDKDSDNIIENTNDDLVEDTIDEIEDNSSEISENQLLNPNMAQEVKYYILYGQDPHIGECNKAKWDPVFLEKVDIDSLYEQFVAEGGEVDDIVGLTWYITKNAPIADDWEETFRERYEMDGRATVTRVEDCGNNVYQVYEIIDGEERATVGVNSRTGYWHN